MTDLIEGTAKDTIQIIISNSHPGISFKIINNSSNTTVVITQEATLNFNEDDLIPAYLLKKLIKGSE